MIGAPLISEGKVLVYDGVGVLWRGDTVLVVYQKAARLARTRWLFDVVEMIVVEREDDILAFMIVLPSADPPDGPTREENRRRMKTIDHRVRRLVTTPIGNAFKINLVMAVMRGLNVMLGHSGTRFVVDSVDEALSRLLEASSDKTPSAEQILGDIGVIYRALGEPEPRFPIAGPASIPPKRD